MMLQSLLPTPKHNYAVTVETEEETTTEAPVAPVVNRKIIPAYPNRKGFVPLTPDDYEDGGAYPEIHLLQHPLNMGKAGQRSSAVIPVQVGASGAIRTDLIVRQGTNSNKVIQTQMKDIKEKQGSADKLALPEESEEQATADRTRAALEALLDGKIKSSKSSTVVQSNEVAEPTYIRYTPNPNAPGYSESAKQRVIKMVEAQVDPMEPPKHKHMKVPKGPGSPPVPVLHSPPRKITVEDQQAWKVPPCVSNWKNARGYIIPLDKRLAADGRGLEEVTINNKFATFSETMYIAERKATEDLKYRNDLRKQIAIKEKEEREANLREMANRARMERTGIKPAGASEPGSMPAYDDYYSRPAPMISTGGPNSGVKAGQFDPYANHGDAFNVERNAQFNDRTYGGEDGGATSAARSSRDDGDSEDRYERVRKSSVGRSDESDAERSGGEFEDEEEKAARQQRERVRMERRKERERDLRRENMKGGRKGKLDRDEGRDVSEKIALGMMKGGARLTGESMYDSRLFNQSAGMDAGFGGEDEYNTYSKPLFDRGEAQSVYRPKKEDGDIYGDVDSQMKKLTDTSRFKPDKGFRGADSSSSGAGPRDAPVQFEKAGASGHRNSGESRRRDDDEEDRDGEGGGRFYSREEKASQSKRQRRDDDY